MRIPFEIVKDMHGSNSLERCFDKEHPQQDTTKLLMNIALKSKKTFSM